MLVTGIYVIFDGIAYGMLLFLMSVGLSVTMGVMGFVNLAHGTFAMIGGYVISTLMSSYQWPFLATLPAAFIIPSVMAIALDRLVYRHLYFADQLSQVLLTIGIAYVSIALVTFLWGPGQVSVHMPEYLTGSIEVGPFDFSKYKLLLIFFGVLVVFIINYVFEKTSFGANIAAAVDDPKMANGIGINVVWVFMATFIIGSGLAGLGGALAVNIVGLQPSFPLEYLIYFLIVVSVGGLGSIRGSLTAALMLGVFDVAGKYYLPEGGAFFIYLAMMILLFIKPQGLCGKTKGV